MQSFSQELMTELVTENRSFIVIDDDPSILRALRRLVSGAGFDVRTFDRPSTLLKSDLPKAGACLIVDIDLPEMNGVELCETLAASGCRLPVILITAHTDEETRRLADGASSSCSAHQAIRARTLGEFDRERVARGPSSDSHRVGSTTVMYRSIDWIQFGAERTLQFGEFSA